MTPQRQAQILSGQSNIARKVYEVVTADQNKSHTVGEIAGALKATTGSGCDIHILRGCLKALKDSGLVREVVNGCFRQTHIKEEKMPALKAVPVEKKPIQKEDAMSVLADIAAHVREIGGMLVKIADNIDTAAVGIEEMSSADKEELKKLRQMRDSFKSLMG